MHCPCSDLRLISACEKGGEWQLALSCFHDLLEARAPTWGLLLKANDPSNFYAVLVLKVSSKSEVLGSFL